MNDPVNPDTAPVPAAETQTAVPNRFVALDGRDAKAALKAGLEITAICIVGIAIILTVYYASLRLLAAAFPPKPESGPGTDDD
jgi:hypothetical protein